jgi:hypothetical protein
MSKIIMAWSKCKIEFGATGENDAFASELTDVGKIKNQSTQLTANDGDTLTETATGGEVVAMEQLDGTLQLETTVIEPTPELLQALGIADAEASGEQKVKTHVVDGDMSVKVTPKNKGARGIKAPVTRMSVAPSFDEQDGNGLKITWNIIKTTAVAPTEGADGAADVDNNYWYSRFTTTEALK